MGDGMAFDRDEPIAEYKPINNESVDVRDVDHHSAFAVLKKKGWFTTVYFLEQRLANDTLAGRYTLFGGGSDDGESSYEVAVAREVAQETGVVAQPNQYVSKHFLISTVPGGTKFAVEIFLLDPEIAKRQLSSSAIRRHQAARAIEAPDDLVGPPKKIRRFGNFWFFSNWSRLSSIAVYALLEDCAYDMNRNGHG